MPFKAIYYVQFGLENLHPVINEYGWPSMEFSALPPENDLEWITDYESDNFPTTFRITQRPPPPPPPTPPPAPPRCHLFVRTPGLALSTRLRLQLHFVNPQAEGFGTDGELRQLDTHPFPDDVTAPEPWVVALNVFHKIPDQTTDDMVRVTCQFNRSQTDGGIRLNTPGSLEIVAGTEVIQLVKPLSYSSIRKGWLTLEHSFCGVGAENDDHRYVIGSGLLKWNPPYHLTSQPPPLEDQRAYSSKAFHNPSQPPPPLSSIAALGVTLRAMGFGRIGFVPTSFVVWENKPFLQTPPPA